VFRIITPAEFTTSAWKNGGGITHEIARDGAAADWRWRLSVADVASDGPFSLFAGYARILTVIEGAGIDLHTANNTLAARPLQPIAFSGDLAIDSRMVRGPIRDFNVIYDPSRVIAHVTAIEGPNRVADSPELAGLLSLAGAVKVAGSIIPKGACALGRLGDIILAEGAAAILVTLCEVQTEACKPGMPDANLK
jgi:environmental stress-induced protein Ves